MVELTADRLLHHSTDAEHRKQDKSRCRLRVGLLNIRVRGIIRLRIKLNLNSSVRVTHSFDCKSGLTASFVILLALLTATGIVEAKQSAAGDGAREENFRPGWSTSLQGGFARQFDTDMNGGGSFSVNRFFIQGGATYVPKLGRSVTISVGYGRNSYDFSGATGLAGLAPWKDIDTLRFGLPVRYRFDERLTLFLLPTLRFSVASSGSLDDGASGGALGGFSYRVSDRLSIGPGVGVLTRIEASTDVFPILLINWKITDRLSLETGRGLAATVGPGLTLNWRTNRKWRFLVGGRFEKLRFRLDEDGPAPRGVGEDRSVPLVLGATYRFNPTVELIVLGGVELDGKLRLNDENGDRIIQEDHDDVAFLALTFRARF